MREDALRATAWRMQKVLQGEARTIPPTWATLERSPQAGAVKRVMKDASAIAKTKFPMLDIDGEGVMHTGGQACASYHATRRGG